MREQEKLTPVGCATVIVLAAAALTVERCMQRGYERNELSSISRDAKDELSNAVLTNPAGYLDQEVAVRGDLKFIKTGKPFHIFSSPDGLNYWSKREDGTYIQTHYTLVDSDFRDRITVRIDEYQMSGIFSGAKYTDYSGKHDLVGTIKNVDGAYILVVDHTPPVKLP